MLEKILGRPLFGRDDNALLRWRSQNLDERPGDDGEASGSKLMHGRGWLYMGSFKNGRAPTLRCEWDLRSSSCRLGVSVDDDDRDITLSAALPPVAIWVGVEGLPASIFKMLGVDYATVRSKPDGVYLMSRRTEISIHHWALWWNFWTPEHMSRGTDPRWRRGSFNFLDRLFGSTKMTEKPISVHRVEIPMPERSYKGEVQISCRTWARPRWPFKFGDLPFGDETLFHDGLYYNIKMDEGEQVPFPGKGENSWDCGEDALFAMSGQGGLEDAIAGVVKSVMRSRRRHGGSIAWKPEVPPTVTA